MAPMARIFLSLPTPKTRYTLIMNWLEGIVADIIPALKYLIGTIWARPEDVKSHPMNQPDYNEATNTVPHPAPLPKYQWITSEQARHSVRVICDEEGLTTEEKNTLCATVGGESEWMPGAIGKPNSDGTRDYGICQVNTHYWIGPGKIFPSTDYVLTHPEECIRWMCKQWKMGHRNWWVAYKNGRYKQFLSV